MLESDTESAPHPQRLLLALYLVMITVGMGQSVVFAILPMLGRELALHELVIGIPFFNITVQPGELAITTLSALSAFTFFIVSPIWGRLSDRWGRKPVILTGLIGYFFGTLIFNGVAYLGLQGILVGGLFYCLMVITRIFHAGIMAGTHPASAAYVADITTAAERTRGMGKLQAFNQLGVMLGPALAWFVHISFLAPLIIQALLMLGAAGLVWRYLPALPLPKSDSETGEKPPRLSYFDKRIRWFLLVGFTAFSLLGIVQQTLGFYFQDILQLDGKRAAQLFSLAMIASSAAILLAQLLVVQRYRGKPRILLFAGFPFSFAGYLLLANATQLSDLLIGMGLFGFGMGLTGPGYSASASLVVEPHEQGSLAGLIASLAGLGFVIGPLLGGFLYGISPNYPYLAAATVMGLIIVSILVFFVQQHFLNGKSDLVKK